MKKVLFILFITLFVDVKSQLVVSSGAMTPTQYVQDVLVGSGVTVSNVTFSGGTEQLGEFEAAGTNPFLGVTNGLVMATGNVNVAVGPNNTGSAESGGGNFGASDPDLEALEGTGIGINDAAVLEFDFIPTGDTLQFNFVFGSEEYPEYVGQINDVFGFFLSGPGVSGPYSNGAANIALVPGTTDPIAINSINSGSNPSYYVDNTINTSNSSIQFDGYTTVMTAIAGVECGETYHIKIAIGDASDTSWDSGVFLEAGSFSSNTVTLVSNVDVANGDSVLFEGCGTALINFVRDDVSGTSVYHYNIYGDVTSSDYTVNADSVVFLPGEDTFTLNFTANNDGLTESLEEVNIEMIQTICGVTDTSVVTFYISEYNQFSIDASDTIMSCAADSVPIWVEYPNQGLEVLWDTGETTDTIWVAPNVTTTYGVTVFDTCGIYSSTDVSTVTYITPSPIVISLEDTVSKYCPQDVMVISVSASGGDGTNNFTFDWTPIGIQGSTVSLSPNVTTTFYVEATDMCGNTAVDSIVAFVPNFIPLNVDVITEDTTICEGLTVTLEASFNGGIGTFYSWNHGLSNSLTNDVTPTVTNTYVFTAQDSCGAIDRDSVTIEVDVSGIDVNIPDGSINCYNEIVILNAQVSGNIGNVSYDWSTGEVTDSIIVSPIITSTYWVEISDLCKTISDTITVVVPKFDSLDIINNGAIFLECPGEEVILNVEVIGGDSNAQFMSWYDGVDTYVGNNIVVYPENTTVYNVTIVDTCAFMTDSASITVHIPNYAPLTVEVTNDTTVCRGDQVMIGAVAQGGAGDYSYNWLDMGSSDSIFVQINGQTTFDLIVGDKCNNYVTAQVIIDEMYPQANFGYEYVSDYTVEFYDSSFTDIVYYQWEFDFGNTSNAINPIYTYLTDGEHLVTLFVQDVLGCTDSIQQIIKPNLLFYIPNSFTPNSDGINDVFLVKGLGIQSFELFIYNRWGEQIFVSDNVDIGWDASYKGTIVENGTYVYHIKAINYDDELIERRGVVNVLR